MREINEVDLLVELQQVRASERNSRSNISDAAFLFVYSLSTFPFA